MSRSPDGMGGPLRASSERTGHAGASGACLGPDFSWNAAWYERRRNERHPSAQPRFVTSDVPNRARNPKSAPFSFAQTEFVTRDVPGGRIGSRGASPASGTSRCSNWRRNRARWPESACSFVIWNVWTCQLAPERASAGSEEPVLRCLEHPGCSKRHRLHPADAVPPPNALDPATASGRSPRLRP